jgi:Ni/Co efflux regulator RcnB
MRLIALATLVALSPAIAFADGGKNKFKHNNGKNARYEHRVQGCPPGLAKKNPPCIPPGQAKKMTRYRRGDHIRDDYVLVRDPWAYGLDRDETYYRVGDNFYRVNRKTGEILDLLGALHRVMN